VAGTLRRQIRAPRARGNCVSAADSPISSIGLRILNRIGSSSFASPDPIRKLQPEPVLEEAVRVSVVATVIGRAANLQVEAMSAQNLTQKRVGLALVA
jgi:hypothetical protein